MSPTEVFNLALGALGLVALLAAGVARWRASSDETTKELWKAEAEAWKAKAVRLEAALMALEKRVDHLEEENRSLRSLHDSSAAIAALRADMSAGFLTLAELIREGRD